MRCILVLQVLVLVDCPRSQWVLIHLLSYILWGWGRQRDFVLTVVCLGTWLDYHLVFTILIFTGFRGTFKK